MGVVYPKGCPAHGGDLHLGVPACRSGLPLGRGLPLGVGYPVGTVQPETRRSRAGDGLTPEWGGWSPYR